MAFAGPAMKPALMGDRYGLVSVMSGSNVVHGDRVPALRV